MIYRLNCDKKKTMCKKRRVQGYKEQQIKNVYSEEFKGCVCVCGGNTN